MADGRRFAVRHPEFVFLHLAGRTVYLVEEGTKIGPLLNLALMNDLEIEQEAEEQVPLPGVTAESGG